MQPATSWQGVAHAEERDELVTCAVDNQAKVWEAARLSGPRLILTGHTGIVLQVRGLPAPPRLRSARCFADAALAQQCSAR